MNYNDEESEDFLEHEEERTEPLSFED